MGEGGSSTHFLLYAEHQGSLQLSFIRTGQLDRPILNCNASVLSSCASCLWPNFSSLKGRARNSFQFASTYSMHYICGLRPFQPASSHKCQALQDTVESCLVGLSSSFVTYIWYQILSWWGSNFLCEDRGFNEFWIWWQTLLNWVAVTLQGP